MVTSVGGTANKSSRGLLLAHFRGVFILPAGYSGQSDDYELVVSDVGRLDLDRARVLCGTWAEDLPRANRREGDCPDRKTECVGSFEYIPKVVH